MSLRPIRGFRFEGGLLGTGSGPFDGLTVTPTGRLAMVDDHEAVRQAILMLLTTTPGERVMLPDYGCPLHRLMFAPNDATTAGLAIHYVREAIRRWEPRVEIVRLDAGPDDDSAGRLLIELVYRLRRTDRADSLTVAVDLQGAG
ncbi:GPW/gp25 family protein [Sphingomonas sp. DT-204]|uniref:GPW/gp25 family protein n=1 Tax=Sphingomonas sp. DT-204 TaxID=3396166 RepID=UPI003F198CCE